MKSDLSRKANEYAEEATNRELYPEPLLDGKWTEDDYDRQRKWLQYYCIKRVEFFSLGARRFGSDEGKK